LDISSSIFSPNTINEFRINFLDIAHSSLVPISEIPPKVLISKTLKIYPDWGIEAGIAIKVVSLNNEEKACN